MDIIAAYREAGTYRGAAEIAGTTHKTVKRVITRHEAGVPRQSGHREAATTTAWPPWSRNAWRRHRADLGQATAAGRPCGGVYRIAA